MDLNEATARILDKLACTQKRAEQVEAEGRSAYWFGKDVEAFQLALDALDYLRRVQEYESSQSPQ